MFGPDYKAGCVSCSAIADGFDGIAVHLANHDVKLCGGVAGAARQAAGLQAADGMDVSLGILGRQRLQLRLQVAFTEEQQREGSVEYNYRRAGHAMDIHRPRRLSSSSRRPPEPTRPPTRSTGRA